MISMSESNQYDNSLGDTISSAKPVLESNYRENYKVLKDRRVSSTVYSIMAFIKCPPITRPSLSATDI